MESDPIAKVIHRAPNIGGLKEDTPPQLAERTTLTDSNLTAIYSHRTKGHILNEDLNLMKIAKYTAESAT